VHVQPKEKRGLRPLKIGAAVAAVAAAGALAASAFAGLTANPNQLVSKMNGKQVVPAGTGAPKGTGHGEFKVRVKKQAFCYDVSFRRTGGPVRGFVFRGKRGQDSPNPGRPAVTLFNTLETSPEAGCVKGLTKKKLRRIKQHPRRFHVVLVNSRYENGAIRGQLKRPQN
jgi:hypothetical protein